MIEFTTYKSTGEIVGTGVCQEELLEAQIAHDSSLRVIRGKADYKTQFFADGVFVNMPPKPSQTHVFDYGTKTWLTDLPAAWKIIKEQRNTLLSESDWVVVKAQESGTEIPLVWSTYRQALRDITLQTDPLNIVWPTLIGNN